MAARIQTGMRTAANRPNTSVYGSSYGIGVAHTSLSQIQEGKYTATIYTLIRDSRFSEVIKILAPELNSMPSSRPLLSLLAYCYYQTQEFNDSLEWCIILYGSYETLVGLFPDVQEYKMYLAQTLFKSLQYAQAQKAASLVSTNTSSTATASSNAHLLKSVVQLQAAIRFEMGDFQNCQNYVNKLLVDDPDRLVSQACLDYKVYIIA